MNPVSTQLQKLLNHVLGALQSGEIWSEIGLIVAPLLLGWLVLHHIRGVIAADAPHGETTLWLGRLLSRWSTVALPLLCSVLLAISNALGEAVLAHTHFIRLALLITVLLTLHRIFSVLDGPPLVTKALRWVTLPLVALHLSGLLAPVLELLSGIALKIGSLEFTLSGVLQTVLFGGLLFWLGWVSNDAGQNMIRSQQRLDMRTREVFAKLFQLFIFITVSVLLLQVMGIDLTALAVFGGALGVGLGFGLQSIASNFISGIIILIDRSVSLGDYVETEDGLSGYVRELNMRHTTLETFDGKDVLVPNEKFITTPFTNWTHQNKKQRYRVDFSVAYHTDVRTLCDLIRAAVASHEQVLSGDEIPFEERPDCEIDSFGDSGINMFVEFWMEGVDDGRNRVGGDLLLLILETLQENGIQIPFPQREVRLLNTSPEAVDNAKGL